MANDLQELRRSAVVSGFGPGSVVDFRADNAPVSGMAAGLEEWDRSFPPAGLANSQVIREERLQKKLGVHGFRLPPVIEQRRKDEDPDPRRLVAVRFPQWLQCPDCDRIGPIRLWGDDPGKAYRYCPDCTGKSSGNQKVFVIPVRFVHACTKGHVDEFPWHWWVNHKAECSNKKFLVLRSDGAGLAGLMLSCPKCKSSRSMDGIFSKTTWEKFANCSGRRPWLADADETCAEKPRALQRGASNLYFPVTQSALSIPPWSNNRLQDAVGTYWETLKNVEAHQRVQFIEMLAQGELRPVLEELRMTPAQMAEAIERQLESYALIETSDLRPAEFRQFVADPGDRKDDELDFEIRREKVPPGIQPWISHVVRAVRLREVRALTGFTRIDPPGDAGHHAGLSVTPLTWLPAIEVRGEGIFLALNEEMLSGWENTDVVRDRAADCHRLYREDWQSRHGADSEPPRTITARFLLCHTLAHALMRQLTLECGYSSASLQERIYASSDDIKMAGILIYTATTDSDGTLGGLQRQGKAYRIAGILARALQSIEWCSSDPLCISDMMGASSSFSKAACHACVLAPETSCETFNTFLDRGLLIGTPDIQKAGFFEDLVRNA